MAATGLLAMAAAGAFVAETCGAYGLGLFFEPLGRPRPRFSTPVKRTETALPVEGMTATKGARGASSAMDESELRLRLPATGGPTRGTEQSEEA